MALPRAQTLILLVTALDLPECSAFGRQPQDDAKKIAVTVVESKSATVTQQYNCRINAHRHIQVRTPAEGHVAAIAVREGQAVKRGDLLFQVGPPVDKENPDAESRDRTVTIKAPFDGLVGRLPRQRGSFVLKGETLTTLSDNSVMWVYFNVPEQRYLEYMAGRGEHHQSPDLELILADHSKFPHAGKIGAIGAEFNSKTGDIPFRADFPNPNGLLRHGETGTLLISRVLKDAILIPQRATFEDHARRYAYVVDRNHVAHQREIVIQNETDDLFIVKKGVGVGDKIVLEGIRLVRDGDKVE
jgi:membrane fusion protein (multidrug efflux system)